MDKDALQELVYKAAPFVAAAVLLFVWVNSLTPEKLGIRPIDVETANATVPMPAAYGLTLLMVETETCGWCKRFHRDVASDYKQFSYGTRAPLRTVHLRDYDRQGYRLARRVSAVPTFILLDSSGTEIDRIRGYPGPGQAFYTAMDRILRKADAGHRAVR